MKACHLGLVCAMLGTLPCAASAQDADPQARAKREADNPLRMIIEAGNLKAKPKAKTAETETAAKVPAEKAAEKPVAVRPVASKPVPIAVVANAPSRPEADVKQVEAVAKPVEEPALAAVGVAATSGSPAAEPLPPPAVAAPAAAAPQEPVAQVQLALSQPTPVAASRAQRATLELANFVEPALTERARRRLRSDGEVQLDFMVNADGSVADVVVRTSNDTSLDPVAVDAVRQWRYKPIAQAQAHGVQLVFKRE